MAQPSRPIIIVTGANSGVGFGTCQRLLFQLCHTSPSDAQPQKFSRVDVDVDPGFQVPPSGYDGLTLIMACRSIKRAEAARTQLLSLLDTYVAKLKKQPGYDGHAEVFQKNVVLDIRELDLAIVGSVFKFATGVSQTYPYVSHLICNAGMISFKSMDWPAALTQVFTDLIGAVTAPIYLRQHVGELSIDGLGWVWQCNVFGHFVLYRALEPLLSSPCFPHPARVIWMSSLEASPTFYSGLEDWQNKTTEYSYQSSKYQMNILAVHLDSLSLAQPQQPSSQTKAIRHMVTHPGLCSTNVNKDMTGPFLDILKHILFYIARTLGSVNHTIDPFKAAIGAVHLSLAPLTLLAFWISHSASSSDAQSSQPSTPVTFGAASDRWGNPMVRLGKVKEWEKNKGDAADLLVKCEELYQSFKKAEEVTMDCETATEHI